MERNKKIMRLAVVSAFVVLALAPAAVHAAAPWSDYFPLVRCGTAANPEPCTPCGLFQAGYNTVNFILFGVTGPIAAAVIVFAGGMFLVGADNPAMRVRAKKMLTQTLLGVTVIFLSWAATDFLIHTLGASDGSAWYEFTCPQFLQDAVKIPTLPTVEASRGQAGSPEAGLTATLSNACKDSSLASDNKTAFPKKNSSDLESMMNCFQSDAVVAKLVNMSARFTYDQSHPLCNYDRGQRLCGACSHSAFSCHYGGRTGSNGAEAVDYNWNGNKVQYNVETRAIVTGECPDGTTCRTVGSHIGLFEELYRANKEKNCGAKLINFEGRHTHVSTKACDSDGTGARGATVPTL